MKLSASTIEILKNFSTINPGLIFLTGDSLRTVAPLKNIFAEARIEETIPTTFAIYDVSDFLSVMSAHKEIPDIDFRDRDLVMLGNEGRSKTTYRYTDPEMIKHNEIIMGGKKIVLADRPVSFELSVSDLGWIMRMSSVLGSPQVAIRSDGEKIMLKAYDKNNDGVNTNTLEIAEGNGSKYNVIFNTENLKIIPGGYEVSVSSKGIAEFDHTGRDLVYFITPEQGSVYEAI